MFADLSRRQRAVLMTAAAAAVFVAATAAFVGLFTGTDEAYVPGEAVAGLTSDLTRSLPGDAPRVTFTDATQAAGITFRHFDGRRTSRLPEDMGSGAAWGDYDGDGWPDLYVANEAAPLDATSEAAAASPAHNVLYRNNGDGTFTDVSAAAGVDYRGWAMGAAWADYDADGHLDLFVTTYGRNVLYRNRGDGTFDDVSAAAGVGLDDGFWTGASWADYDRDGHLDLYVTGYVRYTELDAGRTTQQYDVEVPASINPSSFRPERNLLFHNNGDGTFDEVAAGLGVDNPDGRSFSAAWADFDADGWLDLYVANDVSDNVMYRNDGDGTFTDVSHPALVADYRGAMGLAVGDWDNDTDLDLFVTHWLAQENALFRNLSADAAALDRPPAQSLQFMDEADRFGVGQLALDHVGWGTAFFDFDNDGRLDLFTANGSTMQQKDAPHRLVPMPDVLLWNGGAERGFFDVSGVAGPYFDRQHVGRGAAVADYDRDGDEDLFVVNNDGPPVLLRNDGGNRRAWLAVTLEGRAGNRQALGAHLRLVAGGLVQVRQVGAQSSYLSQHSLVQHFGLGDAPRVDTLEVTWPDGRRRLVLDVAPNQMLHLTDADGTPL